MSRPPISNNPQLKTYTIEDDSSYLPHQADSYLNNLNEWRNIQEVIRLTLRSLTDVVRAQGQTIKELEKQLCGKAAKSELLSALNIKANTADIMRSFSEMANSIESRASLDEVRALLEDKASKNELIYHLNAKANKDEVKILLEEKVDFAEFNSQMNEVKAKQDDNQKEILKRMAQFATEKDIIKLQSQINQKANQSEMSEALSAKPNKEFILSAINKKSNQSDIETVLNSKADKSDIAQLMSSLLLKVDLSTYTDSLKSIESKADKKEMVELRKTVETKAGITDFKLIADAFQDMKGAMGKRIDDIDQDLDNLIENIKQQFQSVNVVLNNIEVNKADYNLIDKINAVVNKKIDGEYLNSQLNQMKSDVFDALTQYKLDMSQSKKKFEDKLNERLITLAQDAKNCFSEITNHKQDFENYALTQAKDKERELKLIEEQYASFAKDIKKDYEGLKTLLTSELELKPDKSHYDFLLDEMNQKVSTHDLEKISIKIMAQLREQYGVFEPKMKEMEVRLSKELMKKVSLAEINCILNEKASKNQLDNKIDKDDFEKLTALYANLTEMLCGKMDYKAFEVSMKNINASLNEIQSELSYKSNIKEMISLLKNKAEVDDVNKALIEIHDELDSKSNVDQFNSAMDNQAIINDALCSENCVGRWMWRSGKVKNGYAIPWEYQSANTSPDNFLWEKEKTFIQVVLSGVYELTIGVYANKKPNVSVAVNGEPIISATNSAHYIINKQSGKGPLGKAVGENITGLTLTEFIILPEKSKLLVSYLGDDNAVGFLYMKKL